MELNNYDFIIQANQPKFITNKIEEELNSAISTIFKIDSECAILFWNHIPIVIDYKYDISVMIEDVIFLLKDILEKSEGEKEIGWGSSTFNSTWKVNWNNNVVTIESYWNSVSGNYTEILNERNLLSVELSHFISEWKMLLVKIKEALLLSGITVTRDKEMVDMLIDIEREIPQYGVLYR